MRVWVFKDMALKVWTEYPGLGDLKAAGNTEVKVNVPYYYSKIPSP